MQQINDDLTKPLKSLPFSESDISVILKNDLLYVDKTKFAYEMVKKPGKYFLSRPRRFGKSMLLSTFEEVFLGNKELFKDQWIYNSPWDWQTYPIIRIDFNIETDADLRVYIKESLKLIALNYGVFDEKEYNQSSYGTYFRHLILKLYEKFDNTGVVVLIDEYDKPILDVIENIAEAESKRDILKGFYTVIKGVDKYLQFVFLTGVSRFSKVVVFSGLNNLRDISMEDEFATVCGITQEELEFYCKDYIEVLAKTNNMSYAESLQKIRDWYNGFCFSENGISVYNPYSTINVLVKKRFGNYWFSSGNASFLIKLIKKQPDLDIFRLDKYETGSAVFSTFEIDNLNIIAILFQAGYLTIKSYDKESDEFTLSYPNREVDQSFKLNVLTTWSPSQDISNVLIKLTHSLKDNNIDTAMANIKHIFLHLDYDIVLSNENNYQSIFYLIFQLLGFNINVEYKTNVGRIDAIIHTADNIYIFEFKLNKTADEALAQIREKAYYARFIPLSKPIYLIGANFNSTLRNIDDYIVDQV